MSPCDAPCQAEDLPPYCQLMVDTIRHEMKDMKSDIKELDRKMSNGFSEEMSQLKSVQAATSTHIRIQWYFIAAGILGMMGFALWLMTNPALT